MLSTKAIRARVKMMHRHRYDRAVLPRVVTLIEFKIIAAKYNDWDVNLRAQNVKYLEKNFIS